MPVFSGRHRADVDGDLVVFLIGLRINKPWAVHRWLPVLRSMGPMIRELEDRPGSGLMGANTGWMFGGFCFVQYWRSFEQLEAYARDPDAKHLPAWARFNRTIRGTDAVGVYHETYRVRAGEHEAMYVDLPRMGLAAAASHVPVGSSSTAAVRIGDRAEGQDEAPVAP